MKTVLPDGRTFETMPFLNIEYDSSKPVYKYKFSTKDRTVESSERHEWIVWNKETKDIDLIRMDEIDSNKHELLIQDWN